MQHKFIKTVNSIDELMAYIEFFDKMINEHSKVQSSNTMMVTKYKNYKKAANKRIKELMGLQIKTPGQQVKENILTKYHTKHFDLTDFMNKNKL